MVETCCQTLRKRLKEIRAIHKKYKVFYWLLGGAIIVLAFLWVGTLLFHDDQDPSYEMNLFTELVGVIVSIGFTVLVVDQINERRETERRKEQAQREQEKAMEELKVSLVRNAASRVNQTAVNAIEELRHKGWLEGDDGLLRNADLIEANLVGADLRGANLEGTWLQKAQLQDSDLSKARLNGARMFGANLREAKLQGTDLTDAKMTHTDLRGAIMKLRDLGEEQEMGVDLFADDMDTSEYHADLRYADLEGAYLEGATLPNESRLYWATLPLGERFDHPFDIKKLKKYTDRCSPEFQVTLEKVEGTRLGIRAVAISGTYAHVIPDEN